MEYPYQHLVKTIKTTFECEQLIKALQIRKREIIEEIYLTSKYIKENESDKK